MPNQIDTFIEDVQDLEQEVVDYEKAYKDAVDNEKDAREWTQFRLAALEESKAQLLKLKNKYIKYNV